MPQYYSSPPSYTSSVRGNDHRTYPGNLPNYSRSTDDERAPLLGNKQEESHLSCWVLIVLISAVLAFTAGLFITLPSNNPAVWRRDRQAYMEDRALWNDQMRTYNREKLDWQKEYANISQERTMMDKERTIWDGERNQMVADRIMFKRDSMKWASEKVEWAVDMDRWTRERRWREEQYENTPPGAYWQEPVPESRCLAYGKRRYTARIIAVPNGWNWVDACKALPIHIHEQTVLTPDQCVDTGRSGTYGHYVIDFGETACEQAFFTDFRELGCVAQGSYLRRTEAQIRNIDPDEDWKAICSTTPANVHGVHYSGPSHCEERQGGRRVAIWDIEDFSC